MTTILAIDVSEHARGFEKTIADEVVASVAVLAGVTDPEDPAAVRAVLWLLLSAERKAIADGVWVAMTPRGRQYVAVEDQTEDGRTRLAFLYELEWRLLRGKFELVVYAAQPEVRG